MASTPTTTVTTVAEATGWAWLKAHERVVMLAMVLALSAFGISKYYDVSAARADAKNVAAQQLLSQAQQNSAAQAAVTAQVQAQYSALIQSLSAENAALNASMAQRTASQKTQTVIDANLPMTGLAARWNVLLPTVQPTVLANGLSIDAQGAHDTVAALESIPVLTANLKDETALAANFQSQAVKCDSLVTDQKNQITGLTTQITDQKKADATELAAAKADGRKNSIKWFKRGFIVGFITGIFTGHAAGI